MKNHNELWNISNRPSTQTKLEILEKVFDVWLTIWNNQKWVQNEWYIIDLFAGRGEYVDNGNKRDGSPLIFLKKIINKKDKLRPELKFKIFLVEKNKKIFKYSKQLIEQYIEDNSIKNVEIKFYNDDCNEVITHIVESLNNTNKHPLFILIDPTGLQIKRNTIELITKLKNPKDIMFNYILEGVRRTGGVAKKAQREEYSTEKEFKTIKTLKDFIGDDANIIGNDIELLTEFVNSVFASKGLHIVGYDIKYPDRNDILYYLLYACKKPNIAQIIKDIYAKKKEELQGLALLGKDFYGDTIFKSSPRVGRIKRKSLLYKTKVEYGNWTINHILGCTHGCKFPCYAMMMAKKFGWVKDYEDWRKPRIVMNALELLEKEIRKYKSYIYFVHLCFMTDPFMYDSQKNN